MARSGACAATTIALLVLVVLVAPTSSKSPSCCVDFHSWGYSNKLHKGCGPELCDACNEWCRSKCRGGECKLRGHLHYCHCYC
ncbi:hypothetical protein GUJ93_ZPchr0006g46038 [Zizania palustris]|uniref:Knottin scorpion toxin-like domain-containing protein n=1 Tax=Zizania palustris TaxID=103762 RepID=A0A8J5VX07_ZIZPA|nr:hypothetical protein GUJ93_ZPchr0006g46038 [Zizania palustris]